MKILVTMTLTIDETEVPQEHRHRLIDAAEEAVSNAVNKAHLNGFDHSLNDVEGVSFDVTDVDAVLYKD